MTLSGSSGPGHQWACGKRSRASSNQPPFTLQSTHMECTGVPCFTSTEEQVLPLVHAFAALFPLPLVQSDADEYLLPSHGPCSHESYPVYHLEGKEKNILPRNPGDGSTP